LDLKQMDDGAKGLVYRLSILEYVRYVWIENDDVRPLRISSGVLATDPAREVVVIAHTATSSRSLLHTLPARVDRPSAR